MKSKLHELLGIALLFITLSSFSQASPYDKLQRCHIGLQTGYTGYHGDIANNYYGSISSNKFMPPPVGLIFKYSLSHRFYVRATAYAAALEATSDLNGKNNFRFHNRLFTYEGQIMYNFSNLNFMPNSKYWYMYGFIGVGNVHSAISSSSENPSNPNAIIYKKWNLTVPGGVGVMTHLSTRIDLGIETGLRYTRTDSLDYWNAPIHRNRVFDKFSFTTVGVYYKFGSKKHNIDHTDWLDENQVIYDSINAHNDRIAKLEKDNDDADEDGVPDRRDLEPNTPKDAVVDSKGRALDTDQDGVPDYKDVEPRSWPGAKVDPNGKMKDDDGDGVPNGMDVEPNSPKGCYVDVKGRKIPVPYDGANEQNVTGSQEAMINALLPSIYFDTDKDIIKEDFVDRLIQVANLLDKYPDLKLDIVGNCDYRLDSKYNMELGQRRAQQTYNYLVNNLKVDGSRLNIITNGKEKPLFLSKRLELIKYNRRVDFFVKGTASNKVK